LIFFYFKFILLVFNTNSKFFQCFHSLFSRLLFLFHPFVMSKEMQPFILFQHPNFACRLRLHPSPRFPSCVWDCLRIQQCLLPSLWLIWRTCSRWIIRPTGRPILTLALALNQIGPDQPIFPILIPSPSSKPKPNPSPSQSSDGVPHRKFVNIR